MIEKILFLSQIFEVEFQMDLHVLRSPESEIHIFRGWFEYVCMSVLLFCECIGLIILL